MNKVMLIGRLGQDPEIRHTQSGDPIANLRVATSERWKDRNGERQEKTEWHRVVIFGKLAGIAEQYLHKGDQVYLEGQIQTRKWQDSDGQDRYSTEVVLSGFNGKMEMLESRKDSRPQQEPQQEPQQDYARQDFDDKIPF